MQGHLTLTTSGGGGVWPIPPPPPSLSSNARVTLTQQLLLQAVFLQMIYKVEKMNWKPYNIDLLMWYSSKVEVKKGAVCSPLHLRCWGQGRGHVMHFTSRILCVPETNGGLDVNVDIQNDVKYWILYWILCKGFRGRRFVGLRRQQGLSVLFRFQTQTEDFTTVAHGRGILGIVQLRFRREKSSCRKAATHHPNSVLLG